MKHRFTRLFNSIALALVLALAAPWAAFASSVDVSVVDVIAPTGSVTLAPGGASGPITINLSVAGNQDGTATFEVYRDWTLSGGTFTGSNPQEFTILPRNGNDPPTTLSTTGSVQVAAGQGTGTFTLVVGVFDITNSNSNGGKLGAGRSASYGVTVSAPVILPTTTSVTCPNSVTYTGSAQTPCTATVTGSGGLNQSLTVSYSNNTNVGTATANASFAGNSSYAPSSDSKTFEITKAASTVSVNCSDVSYTSAAQTPCTAAVTGAGGLNQSLVVNYSNNTNAGTATASASYAGDASHTANSGSATFEIAKATSTTTVTCPGSVTYDGSAQTPCSASYSGVDGLNGTLIPTYSNNTNAGTATATATFGGDANHDGSSDTASFTIDKAASVTNITCPTTSVDYTGAAIEPCTAIVAGAGGLNQLLAVTYTNNINAGTASASASYAGDNNHTNSSSLTTFQIGSVGSSTTITCPPNVTYNGSAQTPCTAKVTGIGGLNQSVPVVYTNNTNAGTATATATFGGDANHGSSFAETTFTIDKADATITVNGYNGVYDRAAHSATGTATGVNGENPGTLALGASFTNEPGGTAHWIFTGNGNYNDASGDVAIVITKANATINVSGYTGTYDGAPHGANGSATGIDGENPGTLDLGSSFTNVPGGTVSWTFTGNGNYNDASGDVAIVINKATSTTTITCPASVTYNGSAQEPCTAKATGAGELNQALTVSYSNNTNAGSATVTATYAGDTNHFGSNDTASFTIKQASSTTTITCPASVTYNGSAQTPCSASVTGVGELNQALTVNYSDNTDAGTASAVASYAGDANHIGSIKATTFEIAKAPSTTTVSCAAGPFTYNSSAQTPCSASVTGVGGLNQTLTVSYSDNTNAGTGTASASYAGDSNHFGSSDSKNFTIAKASSTTTVTCTAGPFTYSGSAQTPCSASVTGVGGLNQMLTVSYSDNTDAGLATAIATYAGDTNHLGSADTASFTIGQASSTTTITCPASVTYNGSAQEPCTAQATGAGELNQTLTVSYSDNTDAGTATASASYAGDSNHTSSADTASFAIAKASSTTTITCPASVTYNGSAQEPCTAKATGAGELNQTLTVSYSNNTDAGTATASASYAGDSNHTSSADTASFAIAKAPSTTTVSCAAGPFTYNGSAQTPCSASVTGVGGLNQALTVSYSNNTNAGTATASASYAGDDNHTGSTDTASFTINRKAASVTVNAASKFYGDPDPAFSGTLTGFLAADSVTATYSRTSGEAAGSYTISAVLSPASVLGNYAIDYNTAQFTINYWTFKGFYQPVDMNGVFNTVKSGSTVPIKFEVFKGSTELVSTSAIQQPLKAVGISCTGSTTDDIELTATGGTVLRYDTTGGQFIYNWQTPSGKAGSCYKVTISSTDGSSQSAYFKLK